jgi:hypothetical protein
MNYLDSTMVYAYLVGYMDSLTKNATYTLEDWINEANQIIDRLNIQMDDGQLGDLMDVYNVVNFEEINGITYVILGENYDDNLGINEDDDGIVYIENYNIKLISLNDFKKLKSNKKNKYCGEAGSLNFLFELPTNKFNIKDNSDDEDEIQPHCYICFNMNMYLNVTCINCYKLYCKNHSYCILGDDDIPYCSQKCFLNC